MRELTGAPPAEPPAVVPPPNPEPWKGLVGFGLIALTGNAESLNAAATAQLDKKWGPWAFGARATGAYGQARAATTAPEVSALRAGLLLRTDRSVSSFASVFLLGGLETDHVKSLEARGFAELGTGITFYALKRDDLERLFLHADVGLRYGYETRYQYFGNAAAPANTALPSVMTLGPRIAAVVRFAPNAHVRLSEEAEFLPNVVGPARYLVNSTTKVNARLTERVSLVGALLVTFDSLPAPGKREADIALTLGLEAVF